MELTMKAEQIYILRGLMRTDSSTGTFPQENGRENREATRLLAWRSSEVRVDHDALFQLFGRNKMVTYP